MTITRREAIVAGTSLLAGAAALGGLREPLLSAAEKAEESKAAAANAGTYTPVVTPNGKTLPFKIKNDVKEFHLIAEPVKREFAEGMVVNCWGYNGQTPGPTIEAVEGDRIRILLTNHLPEETSFHPHGVLLPNGMDGVGGLTQKHIPPGATFAYEFTLRQHGTQMYHPHSDEMVQMALGAMGFLIIHPKTPPRERVDRDFAIFLAEWFIEPGASTPNPSIMTDFNLFTFNSRVFPGTDPLVVRLGQRVRIRIANLSMDSHPIHLHGHRFWVTETDGGQIPKSAQWPETTVNVHPGSTRTIEFVADNPGDWAFHCHKSHHTMNAMSHDLPNMLGVDQSGAKINDLLGDYMAMGETGMAEMAEMHMEGPRNTLPMMMGKGPFGAVGMGGMFTVLKIRKDIASYADPPPYEHPPGTLAGPVG